MKIENRSATLLERLAQTKFAERAPVIADILEGKEQLRFGTPVDVQVRGDRKAPNGREYHVRIAASTESIARDAGIIPITAWAKGGLKNFVKNPVILAFHDHKQPIGISVHTELTTDELIQYWEFHQESDVSKMMKTLYERGFMRAASVGFLVHDYQFIDELDEKEYEALEKKYGARVKDIYWIATRAELLETSAVPVPSDPNALEFSFAARNAEAIGLDMSIFADRSQEMKTDTTKPVEKGAAPEVSGAPAAAPAATETQPDVRAIVTEVLTTALKGLEDKFEKRFVALEEKGTVVPASTPAAGSNAPAEARAAEDEIEIEIRPGETAEQAVHRTVDEVVAKLSGAPVSAKTK